MKRTWACVAAATLGIALLSSCGSDPGSTTAEDPADGGAPATSGDAPMPTSVPPPEGEVVAVGTVMDTGSPELCLGAVAESYPPQCSGIPVEDWDWGAVKDTAESSGGTRWGSYAVTGTYDGTTFTVTQKPVPSALYDPAAPVDGLPTSPCPEPAGGWQVVEPGKAGFADQDAVNSTAAQLPGYAGLFLTPAGTDAKGAVEPVDPGMEASQTVVNVLVTQDVQGAEKALREVWGGPLCVAEAQHTEQELIEVQDGLQGLPGLLASGAHLGRLTVDVVWDDGTLQDWADATYGEGLVAIRSAMRPVDGSGTPKS